jgi:hypothetical protein
MKYKALISLLASIIFFCVMVTQNSRGAWWGHGLPPIFRVFFIVTLLSFLLAIFSVFFSIGQMKVKSKQYNAILNWITLVSGIIWALFIGYGLLGITRIFVA